MPPSPKDLENLAKLQKCLKPSLYQPSVPQNEPQRNTVATSKAQEASVKVLDNYSHFIQIIRRLGSSIADLKAELAARPTPESQQALEERIADLERRPTIESHQALRTKIADLQKRPTNESHQALQKKTDGLEAKISVMRLRRPARSHRDLQDEHQALQDRLVELEQRSTPQSRAILQDELFDLDCYYTQGVFDLETEVASLQTKVASLKTEVTELRHMLAFEEELHLQARRESYRQKQLRAGEEADYIAEVEALKTTKTERNDRVAQLQSPNDQLYLQYQRLGVSSISRKKWFRAALIAERRKASLQTQSAATVIQQKQEEVHGLHELLQRVITDTEDLEKLERQSAASQLVVQQLLLRVQTQSIRQKANSAVQDVAFMMAVMMSAKAMRQSRWHTSFVSKARSKIQRLERDLQSSNVILAQTQSSLVASEQFNDGLVHRLDQANEVQSAMRVLLDAASTKSTRLARWHASSLDQAHSKFKQSKVEHQSLQKRIDRLELDFSTYRDEAATFRQQIGKLETCKNELETQVKDFQGLQAETDHEQQNASSQIAALRKGIRDYEKAFELTVQSRTEILLFIYGHFGIDHPLCTDETVRGDFASQDELVSTTSERLSELRALSRHKTQLYSETKRLYKEEVEFLNTNKSRMLEQIQFYKTTQEQDTKSFKLLTAEKQELEAKLHQSKVKYNELAHKTRTGLEKAASLRRSLETSHQATIDDLKEKLSISVAEFNKLADMARRGFP
ncbi:hypothetical protein E8E11_009338 [Didymella keratinophila]|nr:hypothetical protein E8E11_009338 [Didymella keratinophila]